MEPKEGNKNNKGAEGTGRQEGGRGRGRDGKGGSLEEGGRKEPQQRGMLGRVASGRGMKRMVGRRSGKKRSRPHVRECRWDKRSGGSKPEGRSRWMKEVTAIGTMEGKTDGVTLCWGPSYG